MERVAAEAEIAKSVLYSLFESQAGLQVALMRREQERAFAVAARLAALGNAVAVEPTVATVGGGSLPGERLASFGVVLDAGTDSAAADGMVRRLRVGQPAVFGRIERDRVVLDLRSMLPEDDDRLVAAVSVAAGSGAPRDGGSGDDDFR